MKINSQILSIPPYISTEWKNIESMLVDSNNNLIILLKSKQKITIPNLSKETLDKTFSAHASYIETPKNKIGFSIPMPIDQIDGLDSMGSIMQHNPSQANTPDLPHDVLNKITSISKIIGIEDPNSIPKAHPNCNCVHCQIARAITGEKKEELKEEQVTAEDLKFRSWDIKQEGDKLYIVTNPLDSNEHYRVFLGKPIGCTCGNKNCEHIKAVLSS